jgi:putative signal transducing protein
MTQQAHSELCRPADSAEAAGVEALLKEEGILCQVVQLRLGAYPTVDNLATPWAIIRVAPEDLDRARDLLRNWQAADREDLEAAWQRTAMQTTADSIPPSFPWGLLVMLLIVAILISVAVFSQSPAPLPSPLEGR